ncbi:hypothetical protein ACJJTC_000841 [Scirpophaga incertulas]
MITRSKAVSLAGIDTITASTSAPHQSNTSEVFRSRASATSAATIKARKATAEALAKRRQYEREVQLANLQKEVEECELQAELAVIEADASRESRLSSTHRSGRSQRSARTEAWVEDAVRNTPFFKQTHEVTNQSEMLTRNRHSQAGIGVHEQFHHHPEPSQATKTSEAVTHMQSQAPIDIDLNGPHLHNLYSPPHIFTMITRSKAVSLAGIDTITASTSAPHQSNTSEVFRSRASATSAATIKARKATAEALAKRRQYEREVQLANLQKEVEECELQAELAVIEADASRESRLSSTHRSGRSQRSARTEAWVEDAVRNTPFFKQTHEVTNQSEMLTRNRHSQAGIGVHEQFHHHPEPSQATKTSEAVTHMQSQAPIDIDLNGPHLHSTSKKKVCILLHNSIKM